MIQDVDIECNAILISQYRFLWLNLSELLQALGNAYARTYSTYCLFMLVFMPFFSLYIYDFHLFKPLKRFCNITIATYGAISEIVDHGFELSLKELGLLVDAAYCSVLLYVFCDCSHQATSEVHLIFSVFNFNESLIKCYVNAFRSLRECKTHFCQST